MTFRTRLLSASLAALASLALAGPGLAKDGSKLSLSLQRVGSDPDIEGSMRFQGSSKGNRFEVRVKNAAPDTDATLRVDDVDRLTLRTSSNGSVKFSFRSPAKGNSVPLAFDPRGETIEVRQSATVFLSVDL